MLCIFAYFWSLILGLFVPSKQLTFQVLHDVGTELLSGVDLVTEQEGECYLEHKAGMWEAFALPLLSFVTLDRSLECRFPEILRWLNALSSQGLF